MTNDLIEPSRERHGMANVAVLVTTVALTLSLVVAVTAVSIGIARADTLSHIAGSSGGRVAFAVAFGAIVVVMGWLTSAMVNDGRPQTGRD
ncbi:MAG: hypothetical protein FJX62_18650 [Alphaproteobacteria bacterium]|nr:hypothetical protein [Alphaproteobacteria bacterium]